MKNQSKNFISQITGRFSSKGIEKFETYLDQGRIEYESGDFQRAIEYLEKAIKESEDKKISKRSLQLVHIYLGRSLDGVKRYDESLKHLDIAIELDPKFHLAWYNKGCSLMEQNAYDKAIKYYDKAFELNQKSDDALIKKADTFLLMNDPTKAIESYKKALGVNPDNEYTRTQIEKIEREIKMKEYDKKRAFDEKWLDGLLKRDQDES